MGNSGHRQITSIDYGNADEVVLSSTQEIDVDVLLPENTLPEGAPRFLLHPYAKRKVILYHRQLVECIHLPPTTWFS